MISCVWKMKKHNYIFVKNLYGDHANYSRGRALFECSRCGKPLILSRLVGEDQTIPDNYHSMEELYEQRALLLCAVSRQFPERCSRFRDPDDPDYFIGYINLPQSGQVSFHIPMKYFHRFQGRIVDRNPWDGHSARGSIERLTVFLNRT